MKTLERIVYVIVVLAIIIGGISIYKTHIIYNFDTITEGKVYKSGALPLDQLPGYLYKYNIKTVIDLREGGVVDPLNPALPNVINKEAHVVTKQGVTHINIPSKQIPNQKNLEAFYEIIDNEDNYPILIHCHHGVGRAVLYSSIYRMEKEGMSNKEAHKKTRFPLIFSNFDNGTEKGEWLKLYEPRQGKSETTQLYPSSSKKN